MPVVILLHLLQDLFCHLQSLAGAVHVDLVGHLIDTEHQIALPPVPSLHDLPHLLVDLIELPLLVGLVEQLVIALHHLLLLLGIRLSRLQGRGK